MIVENPIFWVVMVTCTLVACYASGRVQLTFFHTQKGTINVQVETMLFGFISTDEYWIYDVTDAQIIRRDDKGYDENEVGYSVSLYSKRDNEWYEVSPWYKRPTKAHKVQVEECLACIHSASAAEKAVKVKGRIQRFMFLILFLFYAMALAE